MNADVSQTAKRQWLPGGSFRAKDVSTPVKSAATKPVAEQGQVGGGNVLISKAIKRRQRLQKLYAELQSLQN